MVVVLIDGEGNLVNADFGNGRVQDRNCHRDDESQGGPGAAAGTRSDP